jgi:hypothetical protein
MRCASLARVAAASLFALAAFTTTPAAPRVFGEDAPTEPKKPDDGGDKSKDDRDKTRGYIGVAWGLAQKLTADERKTAGITVEKGMVITHVMLDSPAMKAAVLVGDVPVSLNGTALPDGKDLPTDDDTFKKFLEEKYKPIGAKINPGDKVALVVERAGKPMTFEIVAMSFADKEKCEELDRQEEQSVKVPKLDGHGDAKPATLDFEGKLPDDAVLPKDILQVTGYWEVKEDESKPGNHVLFEGTDLVGDSFCVSLLVNDGHVYADGKASIRFALKEGERSRSAGVVVRCQDRRNYYVLRVDGVTQDVSIVRVIKEEMKALAKTPIKSPKPGSWHTLDVSFSGKTLEATYDGTTKVTATDATFASGWAGLVTFGDARTDFDEFTVTPAAPPSAPK